MLLVGENYAYKSAKEQVGLLLLLLTLLTAQEFLAICEQSPEFHFPSVRAQLAEVFPAFRSFFDV